MLTGRVSPGILRLFWLAIPLLLKMEASALESLRCISGVLERETAKRAPAVAESRAIPVRQKNSHVKRPFPFFFGGILPERVPPVRAVAR
jgi:hypothetical protein